MSIWLLSRLALADPLVALVVVDQAARDEGYALQLEDLLLDHALPVEVAEGERVEIVDPDGVAHPLDVAPGEAWEVTGAAGEAWMSRLGEEIRTDLLAVKGDPEAIRALARDLDARIVAKDGQVWLVGPDVLFAAPWAGGEGLDEVRFVRVDQAPEVRDEPTTGRTVRRPMADATVAPAPIAAASPPGPAPVAVVSVVSTPVAPAAPQPPAPPVRAPKPTLDPDDYVGLYLCADGAGLVLDPSGLFAHPKARGEWHVSAPGVVRLTVNGEWWGRAAIEVEHHWCRAVW